MRLALNGTLEIQCFECNDAIKTCDGIMFVLYPGLPQTLRGIQKAMYERKKTCFQKGNIFSDINTNSQPWLLAESGKTQAGLFIKSHAHITQSLIMSPVCQLTISTCMYITQLLVIISSRYAIFVQSFLVSNQGLLLQTRVSIVVGTYELLVLSYTTRAQVGRNSFQNSRIVKGAKLLGLKPMYACLKPMYMHVSNSCTCTCMVKISSRAWSTLLSHVTSMQGQ